MSSWKPFQAEMATMKQLRPTYRRKKRIYPERDLVHIPFINMLEQISEIQGFYMHIGNERKTSSYQGMMFKAMGVLAGVSDVFLAWPNGRYAGYWIELKAPGKKLTKQQKEFLERMALIGYCTGCFDDPDKAYESVLNYLGEKS